MSRLAALALIAGLVLGAAARAQVVTDGSLGPAGTVPGGALPDGRPATYRIDEALGQRRGQNLFQSFSQFDVARSDSAAFTADAPTRRVLARVTSGTASFIDGALWNAIDGADLYFVNPAGVVFGSTAQLDLHGSLYVSTANFLRMEDGGTFSASPMAGEVLSVAPPSAFGFTSGNLGFVTLRRLDRPFAVPDGRTLSFTSGDITITSSGNFNTPSAPGGSIELATRKSAGEIPVDAAAFDVHGAAAGELGSVALPSNARLDVRDPFAGPAQSGRIVIRSGTLVMDGGAQLLAGSAASSVGGAPDVDIATSESVALGGASLILAAATGSAAGGGIRIATPRFDLTGGAVIESRAADNAIGGPIQIGASDVRLGGAAIVTAGAFDAATAGRIALTAGSLALTERAQVGSQNASALAAQDVAIDTDRLDLSDGASVLSAADGEGAGAALRIRAGALEQSSGGRIESRSTAAGRGGDIAIQGNRIAFHGAPESFEPGGVIATTFGVGSTGSISVSAGALAIEGGAQLSATTLGDGAGGDVSVDADEIAIAGIALSGPSGIFARSGLDPLTLATGNGGSIALRANTLALHGGAEISASSFSSGSAGGVSIAARDSVTISGADTLRSSINAKTTDGPGGDVAIDTRDLRVENGSEISVSTLGQGASGDIAISARRVFVGGGGPAGLDPAGIFAQSIPQTGEVADAGDGGNIEIRAAKKLELSDGALISAKTRGAGDAGAVRILGTDRVRVSDGEISARSEGPGQAGSVTLDGVGVLRVGRGGLITTETLADGPGGAIDIRAKREVIVANGGAISARSGGTGDAGSIDIDAGQKFTARDGGSVTTEALAASGGSIDVRARQLLYLRDGQITTSVAGGSENGGNITLDPEFVVLDHGSVIARAVGGNGGNILIQTSHFVPDVSSVVDASSELGIDGEIVITSPGIDLTSELTPLDDSFLDPSSELARTCAARSGQRGTFVVGGRAASASPDAPLAAPGETEEATGCPEPRP